MVFGCGEDDAGGGQATGGEAADGRRRGCGMRQWAGRRGRTFGGGVIRPRAGRGEACGEVGSEQGLADAGVADEERKAAEGEALRPEPVDVRAGRVRQEARDRGWGAGAVVLRCVVHYLWIIDMLGRGGQGRRGVSLCFQVVVRDPQSGKNTAQERILHEAWS